MSVSPVRQRRRDAAANQGPGCKAGLSRLVAGYAWPWKTKKDKDAFDIEIDGIRLRWNSTQTDWIASPNALEKVGSIHTVQGYDLNYAGVIIGPDLGYDPTRGTLIVNPGSYFDTKGKENNPRLGKTYADDREADIVLATMEVCICGGIRPARSCVWRGRKMASLTLAR